VLITEEFGFGFELQKTITEQRQQKK